MRARAARAAALAATLVTLPAALAAQDDSGRRVALMVTVHAGGTAFTRMQNITVDAPGSEQGTYAGSLAASTAASLGADLTVWFGPWLGARLHMLYAPSNFELRLTEEDREEVLGVEADYRSLDYSDLSLFALTGAVVLALPIRSAQVAPYALLGMGGALLSADDRGAQNLNTAFEGNPASASLIGVAGVGIKIPLNAGRVSISFEITDHVMRSPIPEHDDRVLLETAELSVVNRQHPMAAEDDARYMHSVGIAAGLSFATGATATPVDVLVR
ncbi:MAG TPA: hypothetical protein VMN78_03850 [Longimicrobiales bacterium]|nr:hypothetical protein [Longimicrobiales bacterium]